MAQQGSASPLQPRRPVVSWASLSKILAADGGKGILPLCSALGGATSGVLGPVLPSRMGETWACWISWGRMASMGGTHMEQGKGVTMKEWWKQSIRD